jgi:hypothetical protein
LPPELSQFDGEVGLRAVFGRLTASSKWYRDRDGDLYGDADQVRLAASRPQGFVVNGTDCNDRDASTHPHARELADDRDNNCNNKIDDGILGRPGDQKTQNGGYDNPEGGQLALGQASGRRASQYFRDQDGDGYGDTENIIESLEPIAGYVRTGGDCNDGNAAISPAAEEQFDSVDNDCNGLIDEGFTLNRYFRDVDGDGYGTSKQSIESLDPVAGYVRNDGDCDDNNPDVSPKAAEQFDSLDNDCDGQVDEGFVVSGTAPPQELPLLSIKDFKYTGAFRLPSHQYGQSDVNFSEGPIAFNPDRQSLYIVGHSQQQAIAEFTIPELVDSTNITDLNIAGDPIQPFATVLDRASGGNPEGNNRIGGMLYVSGTGGSELLINAYEYYDGPGDNKLSMLVVRDATDLAESNIDGYFTVEGGPGHTAGWMSPIPSTWRSNLGGDYLTGNSSGIPIISRTSVGPSAFIFNPLDIVGQKAVSTPISTSKLLDFSLAHPLHHDLSNESRKNDLWNHLSRAVYGIIIPGTRTYATFGYSGGNESGVGYKIVQDNGITSGGYSSYAVKDNYHYYWLWDVNDLVRVRAGEIQPYDVRPYEYGIFRTPFADASYKLGGGAFDAAAGRIYLTAQRADRQQGTYTNPPVVMAYKAVIPAPR